MTASATDMARAQQRKLVAQLGLFKERLLAIDTRNPSLLLRRETQERCFDLAKLGTDVIVAVYRELPKSEGSLPLVLTVQQEPEALSATRHLQQLARAARSRRDETGLEELYLGVGWLTGHLEPRTYLRGPLLLIPAQLQQVQGKRQAGWHLLLRPEEVVLNAAIVAAIRKHRGVRLPDSLEGSARELLQGFDGNATFVGKTLYGPLAELLGTVGLQVRWEQPPSVVRALTRLTNDLIPKQLTELRLTCELVVGLFPQSSTALYADLETMIARAENGECDMGIVDNLLEAPADPTTPEDPATIAKEASQDIPEATVHTVIATDPSQHLVLKQAQTAECLVVRGPPGTGKSQVIVNLIADALARNKRVAVVCQKRAALDVVYRRLEDVGLGSAAALVHDAAADRAPLYKRLHAQLQGTTTPSRRLSVSSERLAAEIDELTRALRELVDPLGVTFHGLALHDLYAHSVSGFTPSLSIPAELLQGDYEFLQSVCGAVDRAKAGKLRFDDPEHPLALRKNWATLGHVESATLQRAMAELATESSQGGLIALPPTRSVVSWLRLHVHAYLRLRQRWFRWLLPAWWRGRSAVEKALSWFGQAPIERWHEMLDRYERITERLDTIGASMQRAWREAHDRLLGNLSQLAIQIERTRTAIVRDLHDIRSHDRLLTEMGETARACLDLCAQYLDRNQSWSEQLKQHVLLHWIDEAESHCPRLRDRVGEAHRALRQQLEQKIEERRRIVALELAERVRARATQPTLDPTEQHHGNRKASTAWNKLAHELGKKTRVKPLRALIHEFAWPMKQQVQCWLTSPEVIAEVFPLERGYFDVVIFDEASQLTLERALPVLYRGKQIVIAGDEQQMPPSDFFSARLDPEEGDDEELQDVQSEARFAESLLSQAKRIYGFRYLAWHYRSQYQQLIEFSNHAFYDGALQVAANVDTGTGRPPIEWVPVDGQWIDQTNPAEAARVVDEIASLLREHPDNPPSFGVITFNQKQQVLIQDTIDARCKTDPEFAQLYARAENPSSGNIDDAPFVKNIENVQGDERDYIFFSIAYAKGPDGILRRNFGPLGLKGGENRLNVAVTRARRGIRVLCSFDPDTLAVEGAKNLGPVLLKKYLQYARAVSERDDERMHAILTDLNPERRVPETVKHTPRFDSPLEEQVYNALVARGLTVFTQWGAGGYFIDLAIVHPHDPSRLCLGIECDGARYHSGRSVRERDIARQSFLENRGWKIHRIWSSDWWRNPQAEIERVLSLLPRDKPSAGRGSTPTPPGNGLSTPPPLPRRTSVLS